MNWLCPKCKTKTADQFNRCSFCGAARPIVPTEQILQEQTELRLKQNLHRAIDGLNSHQIKKAWQLLEDHIL